MPRVIFTKPFSWPTDGKNRNQTIQYLPGMRELVTTPCAQAAIAAGAAVAVEKPAEAPAQAVETAEAPSAPQTAQSPPAPAKASGKGNVGR